MKIKFLLLFFFACNLLCSQPILTRNNYFEINDSILLYQKSDTTLFGFSTGSSGANMVWDFSMMDFTHPSVTVDTVIYLDPNGTPFYPVRMSADYSQSNLCFLIKTNPYSPLNYDYNYCYINADSLSFIGHWPDGGGNEIWEDHCSDYLKLLKFPFTYQNNFVDTFKRFYFDMSGSDGHYISGTHAVTADGYGSLITPDGTTIHDILRIHSVESVRDSNVLFGINYRTQHNYYWYSANQRGYIFRLEMYASDSILISSAYYQKQTNLHSSIQGLENKNDFILYPNPGAGCFRISNTGRKIDLIEIYDSKGKFIQSIRPFTYEANDLNLSFLPAGMYMIRVENDLRSFTQKLMIE
ncbi:MAG: T9SS type A sorting domain-containing protein [Bacteroidetes bacterium]|nr:MAG: T9SS type A sorting domain-containing protein [Bacteroidota bacterium]